MVVVVSENVPLIEELRELLKQEYSASPIDRALLSHRISALEDRVRSNVALRLSELGCEASEVEDRQDRAVPPKKSYKADYEALKRLYREAMALAGDCSRLKKMMRERKKEGDFL